MDPGSVKVLQQKSKFGNLSQVCTWSEGEKGTCDRVQQVGSLFSLPSKNPEPPWISPAQPPAADPSPPEDEPLRPTGPPSLGTSAPPQSSTPHSTVGFGSVEPPPPSLLSRETSKAHPRFCWSGKIFVHGKKGWQGVHGAGGSRGLRACHPATPPPAQLWGLPATATPIQTLFLSSETFLQIFPHLSNDLCCNF